MTRMQTLLVTTVLAAAVPLATAMAQSSTSSCRARDVVGRQDGLHEDSL